MIVREREHQLFLDDAAIESYQNLKRQYHTPQRLGIVLEPDQPWELNATIVYGSVLRDPASGKLRMWYTQFSGQRGVGRDILYAESCDGVRWDKPSLGLVPCHGSKQNNIVIPAAHPGYPDGANVIHDPNEKRADKRYKLICCRRDGKGRNYGLWVSFSPDGFQWRDWIGPVAPAYGDRNTLMHDANLARPYVVFTRPPPAQMVERFHKRILIRLDSRDMRRWQQSDMLLQPDLRDPLDAQFYSMVACKYESLYLGFLQQLHSRDDRLDIELVTSRDSIHWQRNAERQPFLSSDFEPSLASRWIGLSSNPPIEINRQLLFFYEARTESHGLPSLTIAPRGAIGLAVICKDRFASLSSGFVPGELVTRPFVCPGGRLLLNLNAANHLGTTEYGIHAGGTKVAVLDETMHPVDGFNLNDCKPLNADFRMGTAVAWKKRSRLHTLAGKRIRLQFWLAHTDLYSFWFDIADP
ncbi:MAG: hypothetical protein HY360_11390 [Verrucomicrobia bacterium]|nr:hypothetical protein [Verrucomicrobiota bacterium]